MINCGIVIRRDPWRTLLWAAESTSQILCWKSGLWTIQKIRKKNKNKSSYLTTNQGCANTRKQLWTEPATEAIAHVFGSLQFQREPSVPISTLCICNKQQIVEPHSAFQTCPDRDLLGMLILVTIVRRHWPSDRQKVDSTWLLGWCSSAVLNGF